MKQLLARRVAGLAFGCLNLLAARPAAAQLGGRKVFPFLDLPPSAALAASGGMNVSTHSNDPQMLFGSPALLNEQMDGRLSLSYVGYVSQIRQSTGAYVFNTEKYGRFGVGVTYLNYGDLESFDPAGNSLGTFGVNEYTLGVSDSYTKGAITYGLTTKLGVSSIAGSRSVAGMVDAGALYRAPKPDATNKQEFSVGLAVKSLGYQFSPYPGTDRAALPLDVQLGTTIRPEHMPVRFAIIAHHLQQWDIQYVDPSARGSLNENNEETKQSKSFGDNLARHFTVSAALELSKGLEFRVGYNHLQRRELRLDNTSGSAGLSLGLMLAIAGFQLDYTYATLQAAGTSHYLTVGKTIFKK